MASGDTKTQQYLDIAARGTRADLQRGCCNTRTQDLIMDVAERIITEEETRYREDQILQGEIDEIKNNPDVYDIVATYADLQDYDTSTITDKDVIRVLRDETHDNASTYYRWDAADQEFDYIGETGDYYTKAQVNALLALKADKATTYTKTETDALLDGKQDVLTAGENITIEDESGSLVVSATDTTYSDFTGTDGTSAGEAGLVPAPATTDAGKFLSASGLWKEVAGGGGITELTTADYNYPTNSPDGINPLLLSTGIYKITEQMYAYINSDNRDPVRSIVYGDLYFVVDRNTLAGSVRVMVFYPVGADLTDSNGEEAIRVFIGNGIGTMITKEHSVLMSQNVKNNLTSTDTLFPLSANQGKVLKDLVDSLAIRGAGAPTTSTVGQVGTLYEDTTNGKLYQCTAVSGNTYTWTEIGAGGSGPTVVQTTGTSTTDVMSQNAVTSMVYKDPASGWNIQIGKNANTANNGVAIGIRAYSGGNGVAMGMDSASSSGNFGIAIGNGANSATSGSIALGAYSGGSSNITSAGVMHIGSSNTSYGYNSSNYRLLTGLYDPQSAHDAATKGYVDPTTDSSAPTAATVGRLGQIQIDTTTATAYMCVEADDVTPSYTWKQITA